MHGVVYRSLFVKASNWRQNSCPLAGNWITHCNILMEFYILVNRASRSSHTAKSHKLMREKSKLQKDNHLSESQKHAN